MYFLGVAGAHIDKVDVIFVACNIVHAELYNVQLAEVRLYRQNNYVQSSTCFSQRAMSRANFRFTVRTQSLEGPQLPGGQPFTMHACNAVQAPGGGLRNPGASIPLDVVGTSATSFFFLFSATISY